MQEFSSVFQWKLLDGAGKKWPKFLFGLHLSAMSFRVETKYFHDRNEKKWKHYYVKLSRQE